MPAKILLKQRLLIIGLVGIILPALIILCLIFGLSIRGSYAKSALSIIKTAPNSVSNKLVKSISSSAPKKAEDLEAPIRLKIPQIKIDVALESVGLTSQGAVGIPVGIANAAWYNLGPHPGDNGNAVITGHYGYWKNGWLGVFNNLSKLRQGDKIYVKDKKGTSTTFVVREFRTYSLKDDASAVFISNDGKAHLNLITCEGAWDKISKSYSKRLVVFTDKE
ncbi:MAG: class F sortase [Candidatus Falkowbacteria bacterium]|nr:class F sortase [Candidatus Falkowbacteria bacterium]